ncbi:MULTISPECIES: cation:proton antiporter regulatory subunit [Haloarcula]|uniref:Potassium transporter n=1 Tax=Haloarcula pellucida TaxID=1427151 RepID=A0A830GK07_9EURY|nr:MULTISPECIES: cation:proton antiporter regulatory subunit [Halomicroarcula]MBX0350428.1 potassium transporter TrkA [Halomicroarcula pellucida]MDS0278731.1 potassium transporter TrkA [Halomicroarcula sp. S1AR25-4]GGN90939.1 potassium transporter [Halomicroarcula pellucida]
MTVYETDVPGVGKKFEVELDGDERLVIVIHHDGKREVFHKDGPDVDADRLFTLSGRQAREIGAILQGAYFQPVETDSVDVPLGDAIIEWVDVEADSPLAGQTLADAKVRQQTGASIIAIQRDEETLPNPDPNDTITAGDILVTLGTRDEQSALEDLITPDDDG